MARVYCGNINPASTERDLDDEFRRFGAIRSIWVARKPPGFAFIEFEDKRDAEDACRKLDGSQGWKVEMSRRPQGGPAPHDPDRARRDIREMRCYECNEVGHIARDCRMRGGAGGGGGGGGRRGSPPPRRERSYSPARRRDDSPPRRRRSPSPAPRRERDSDRDAKDREERYKAVDDSPRRGRSPE